MLPCIATTAISQLHFVFVTENYFNQTQRPRNTPANYPQIWMKSAKFGSTSTSPCNSTTSKRLFVRM